MRDILLLEYTKLKEEQLHRIGYRESLFYVTLVVIGGVVSAVLSLEGADIALLLLAPVLFILCNSFFSGDVKVSQIGDYVKQSLAPRLGVIEGLPPEEVFHWEHFHRYYRGRFGRKLVQFVSNMMLFPGAAIGALAWYWYRAPTFDELTLMAMAPSAFFSFLMLIMVLGNGDFIAKRKVVKK